MKKDWLVQYEAPNNYITFGCGAAASSSTYTSRKSFDNYDEAVKFARKQAIKNDGEVVIYEKMSYIELPLSDAKVIAIKE